MTETHPGHVRDPRRIGIWLVLGAAAMWAGLAGCKTSASVAPHPDLQRHRIVDINGGEPIRIDVVLAEERPANFGASTGLAERWFNELCHERTTWDAGSRAIHVTLEYDPRQPEGKRLVVVDGDDEEILEGLDREDAKHYRYAAVFWWYRPRGERGFAERGRLDGAFVLLVDSSSASVDWNPSPDLVDGLGDSMEGLTSVIGDVFEGIGDLLGGIFG